MEFSANHLILNEMTVDNGPYMQAKFASLIDADCTDQANKILGEDFRRYLDQYFVGWETNPCCRPFPSEGKPPQGQSAV
jgi:hypothetical protein